MRLRRHSNGQVISLAHAKLIGAGGEARIYLPQEDTTLVAKVWHKPTPERIKKVQAMIANPPVDPTVAQKHSSIAWPVDMIESASSHPQVMGFLMPYVKGMRTVFDFFNPKSRRERCPLFNYFYLHRTARNLAIAIRALHERNYVIGDLNESNVLVAETALTTIVDTDSFQVWDAERGIIYRCRVGKPEFTPPEMQGKTFSEVNRSPQQDLFGLGTIIFQLLMEGTHPFAGSYTGTGEAPTYEQRISAGHFPYSSVGNVPYTPKAIAPPFETLHPALQNLFIRCFVDGHRDPNLRPDTTSWQIGLEEAENSLVTCWNNEQHIYGGHLAHCPWCERTKLLGGRDPFPSVKSVKQGNHMGPAVAPPKSVRRVPQPRSRAIRVGAPVAGPPPIPRPVPNSRSQSVSASTTTSKKPFSGFPGPRNDWAWIGLFFSSAAIVTSTILGLPYLFGILGGICGIYGEVQSHGWYLDGKGRWVARWSMLLAVLAIWFAGMVKH
ncbi:MAG: protein kinase domain-containing protein [Verrucomicrobiales bacterium]